MQFSVTFRHMEATEALKEYTRDRIEKIKKYFPDPIACHVVLSHERHHHRVDVNLQLHNGFRIAGHETTENMYSSIDMVSAKIERQVRRYKDKLRAHKGSALEPLPVVHSVVHEAPDQVDRGDNGARGADGVSDGSADADSESGTSSGAHLVIRREAFDATPLSVAEAIMQLNLLHEDFHVFRNVETEQVNVVYRRPDGSFGLIETGPSR